MIKFNRFVFISMVALFITSCADSDFEGTTYPENAYDQRGTIITVSDIITGFYNLQDPSTASVGFTVGTKGETASNVDIFKSFNGGTPVLHTSLTTIPGELIVPLTEAAAGLVDVSDLEVGDFFTFSFESTTASGTFGTGTTLRVDVSCPSDLAGTYAGTATGTSTDGCCPGTVDAAGEVVLTDMGGGTYTISDWTANLYQTWYGPGGGNYGIDQTFVDGGGMNATISELCGVISGSFAEPFGTPTTLEGNVDPVTGVITFSWVTGYDDRADVVLTPM